MIDELSFSMVTTLAEQIRCKSLSPVELIQHCLRRVELLNPDLNSFVAVYEEDALQVARDLEKEIMKGRYRGLMHGIPVAIKDNCDVAGRPTTGCSKALLDNVAIKDATCVRKLREAGAIIIGKTNMHELAYGGTGEVSCFGPAHNPWDLGRNTGGSSSGSGAAVAAGLVPAALGTDTGGSIRIPSCACGITGYKAAYGSVSRAGVLPLSWTLDHVGPMARSVEDAQIVLGAIAGPDFADCSTLRTLSGSSSRSFSHPTLGAASFPGYTLDIEVNRVFEKALKQLNSMGFSVESFDLNYASEAHNAWLAIMYSEASARYQDLLSARYFDFSEDCRTQLEAGRYVLARTYLDAQRFRGFYIRYFESLMKGFDALVMPSLPTVAPRIGQMEIKLPDQVVSTQNAMTFTNLTANMLGWPAISVPCGFSNEGLPVGLTVMTPPSRNDLGLDIAKTYQHATEWHLNNPSLNNGK
jgi:aspartyl-tRNA(Asn)/glutamyl-tRNA(Gln) amidotransferase subunit A